MASLTRNQQLDGQKCYLLGATVNPLGASFIMGPVVSLLALHYGANDFHMGIIYAAVYLTCLMALLPPLALRRVDISRILSWAWIIRGVVSGVFLLLPFLPSNEMKIYVLIGVLLCFTITRAVGACAAPPVLRALTRANELTRITGSIWSRWYFGVLCSTTVSFIVLQNKEIFPSEEMAFMSLLAVAFLFNVCTGIIYAKLPLTGHIEGGGLIALARAVQYIRRTPVNNSVMLVTLFQVILAVAAAYQLSHIQGPLGFSPGYVFALTLAGIIGAFCMAKLVSLLEDRISFRALLFITHLCLGICSVLWLAIDVFSSEVQGVVASVLYITATTFLALSATVLAAMSTASLPHALRVEVSTIYLLNTAISAGVGLGLIYLSGWLLKPYFNNPYAFAYIPWLLFSILICLWALMQKSENGKNILLELQQLKPSNIQSMYLVQRVDQDKNSTHRNRVRQIENALLNNTPASREKLLKLLQSKHVTDRLAAYYNLFERPYSPAYPLVAQEAVDPYSPVRTEAITALGLSNETQYITVFESLLQDQDLRVQSGAIKSLLRMNALDNQVAIDFYKQATDHRQRLDVLIGLSENKQADVLRELLIADAQLGLDMRWLVTISLQWADALCKQARLAAMIQLEEDRAGEGVEDFLRECATDAEQEWQVYLEQWLASKDPQQLAQEHPALGQWPVRQPMDLLLQMLIYVWSK